jgi:hypothetical protein
MALRSIKRQESAGVGVHGCRVHTLSFAFSMAGEGEVRVRSMMQELLVVAALATGAAYHIALVVALAAALT